ncbi:N-6 DNA methylase, partial [Undibacterium sp. GrIS 1.2]|uniref:N-6 DNA methylase n=1 Tax=Undibacterium sp. GrIS 1.2 TaxID=3143933 RepID=UPI0033956540
LTCGKGKVLVEAKKRLIYQFCGTLAPFVQKHPFINASGPENFEKGKRQNRLMDEHIAKIIDTYQFRKEEERYSKQVSMERIAEEGYNLNISRYISTGTPEKEIVLSDVNAELIDLERKIKEAKKRHNEFLKELEQLLLP